MATSGSSENTHKHNNILRLFWLGKQIYFHVFMVCLSWNWMATLIEMLTVVFLLIWCFFKKIRSCFLSTFIFFGFIWRLFSLFQTWCSKSLLKIATVVYLIHPVSVESTLYRYFLWHTYCGSVCAVQIVHPLLWVAAPFPVAFGPSSALGFLQRL